MSNLKASIPTFDDIKDALALAGGQLWAKAGFSVLRQIPVVGPMVVDKIDNLISSVPMGKPLVATVVGGALAGSILGPRIGKMAVLGGLSAIAAQLVGNLIGSKLLATGKPALIEIGANMSGGLADYVTAGPQGALLSDYVTMSDYAQPSPGDFAERGVFSNDEVGDYYGVTAF